MATITSPKPGTSNPGTSTSTGNSNTQTNHYIRRIAASSNYKCLVCLRPTSTILVSNSIPNQDWFPSCQSHLNDRHFATRIQPDPSPNPDSSNQAEKSLSSKVSKEEIEKVKREWEQREKEKKEKKEKEKAEQGKDKDKEKEEKGDKEKKEKSWLETLSAPFSTDSKEEDTKAAASSASSSLSSKDSAASIPTGPKAHERYSLHRDFYQMRVEERKKKEAVKRAAELKLPQAPKGALGGGI